jgi:hypothetical protein
MNGLPFGGDPMPCALKLNMSLMLPVMLSKLPGMRPSPQLSSTNLVIEVWLVSVLET